MSSIVKVLSACLSSILVEQPITARDQCSARSGLSHKARQPGDVVDVPTGDVVYVPAEAFTFGCFGKSDLLDHFVAINRKFQ